MANQSPVDWAFCPDLEEDVDFWLCSPLSLPLPDSLPLQLPFPGIESSEREDSDLESWLRVDSPAFPLVDRFPASELQSDIVDKKSDKTMGGIWKTTLSCPKATAKSMENPYTVDMSGRKSDVLSKVSGQSPQLIRKLTDLDVQSPRPAMLSSPGDTASSEASSQSFDCKGRDSGRKKGKAGKKPCPCVCFLCPEVLPYRIRLIAHLKKAHGIERSQSLMYKRLNQGEDVIKRLYLKYRKNYRLDKC